MAWEHKCIHNEEHDEGSWFHLWIAGRPVTVTTVYRMINNYASYIYIL